jgi:hypothetical protein
MTYHYEARTHLSLDKDAPIPREVQGVGRIFAQPISADCITGTLGFDLRKGQVITDVCQPAGSAAL